VKRGLLIGLTGGIATGKSTAARFFREAGAEVVDADRLARSVVEPGRPALEEIRAEFGLSVIRPDGSLDRAALAARVFGDEEARGRLNRIVHPRVEEEAQREVSRIRQADPGAVIVYDVPLLFEGARADRFDAVVVVYVPREEQLRRVRARDGLTEEEALARLASQMDIEEKARRADFVLDNTGSPEDLRRGVERLLDRIGGSREN
jgi:dephospho-CoA kinase